MTGGYELNLVIKDGSLTILVEFPKIASNFLIGWMSE